MGMFDSLHIHCPKCNKLMEFQSKSGRCAMDNYTEKDLPVEVAVGINGDVAHCVFCNTNWKLECNLPVYAKVKLVKTEKKSDYPGNFHPGGQYNVSRGRQW